MKNINLIPDSHSSAAKKSSSKKMSRRTKIIMGSSAIVVLLVSFLIVYGLKNKRTLAISSFSMLEKVSKFLPISQDEKKELAVINTIVTELTKKDDVEKTFLVMLQNEAELRPGGGFLGQYAIIKM
ncbi:MAG: hypothetical protein ACD_56C00021G0001, partial [uncultured bacterium]